MFAPILFVEVQNQGRAGVERRIDQFLYGRGRAVKNSPANFYAVYACGLAPMSARFIF
jgi:hypothetical protein